MISEHHSLTPSEGWPSFTRSDDLVATIAAHLLTSHTGSIWRYYNLTSSTSIWSSDTLPLNELYLSFSSHSAEGVSQLEEFTVIINKDQSEHYKQLSSLVYQLTADFGLTSVISDVV